jgi:hypothetical protein
MIANGSTINSEKRAAQSEGAAATRLLRAVGAAAIILLVATVPGVGHPPHPLEPAQRMADHFAAVRGSVLMVAPFGFVGAAALGAFFGILAARLKKFGEAASGSVVTAAGAGVVAYFAFMHFAYTLISYALATESAATSKALFVATIMAVPILGASVALALAASAVGLNRIGAAQRWWTIMTGIGAAVASVAVGSYQPSGFFSPDVQQQVVFVVLVVWLLITVSPISRLTQTKSWRHREGRQRA